MDLASLKFAVWSNTCYLYGLTIDQTLDKISKLENQKRQNAIRKGIRVPRLLRLL